MLAQEVREALQVAEDYKTFNQNTITKVARRCPISKAVFYETVKVDENAVKFKEKYLKEAKKKKQEKHLGKQLMSAPKVAKAAKVKTPKAKAIKVKQERIQMTREIPAERLQLMSQAYDMRYINGMKLYEIAAKFNLHPSTVAIYINTHRKLHNLPAVSPEALLVRELISKNFTIPQAARKLGLRPATVHYHTNKLKEHFPDVVINRDRSDRKPSLRTYAIQQLVEQGKTPQEIALELNIPERNVLDNIYRWEKRNGTYKRKEIITETYWKVKELYEAGLSTNAIAIKLSIKWETSKNIINKIERLKTEEL